MRKRRLYLGLIGVGVLVGVIALVLRPEREPEYGGKKLSEWAEVYTEGLDAWQSDEAQRAGEAIRQIGTNALPCLLKWTREETPRWTFTLKRRFNQIVARINPNWEVPIKFRSQHAYYALMALDYETLDAGGLKERPRPPRLMWVGGSSLTKMQIGFEIGWRGTNHYFFDLRSLELLMKDRQFELRRVATNAMRRIGADTNFANMHE